MKTYYAKDGTCPRCGLNRQLPRTYCAVAKLADIYICTPCGWAESTGPEALSSVFWVKRGLYNRRKRIAAAEAVTAVLLHA